MTLWPQRSGEDFDRAFAEREARGEYVHGEADFVAALAPRTVLDAGCGTGRIGIELARRGIRVAGVDRDAGMLEAARRKAPELDWSLADLAYLDLHDAAGGPRRFDVAVMAGNVVLFLDPGTLRQVVQRIARHLEPGGALVSGFQLRLRGGVSLAEYDRCCDAAGLRLAERFSTWERADFGDDSAYAVSVHRSAAS